MVTLRVLRWGKILVEKRISADARTAKGVKFYTLIVSLLHQRFPVV